MRILITHPSVKIAERRSAEAHPRQRERPLRAAVEWNEVSRFHDSRLLL